MRHPAARRCGLSPRVRGNLTAPLARSTWDRSIPACAGEPWTVTCETSPETVYPRVCGGTRSYPHHSADHFGLSPRVRGNLSVERAVHLSLRSIPACAGETVSGRICTFSGRTVYPRVCGGNRTRTHTNRNASEGLSPRVRGNPRPGETDDVPHGSIPACAGEPPPPNPQATPEPVYPRVCGGTQKRCQDCGGHHGSIPACAGEPIPCHRAAGGRWVYPRVCGGTAPLKCTFLLALRSIPACAGEPEQHHESDP